MIHAGKGQWFSIFYHAVSINVIIWTTVSAYILRAGIKICAVMNPRGLFDWRLHGKD